MDLVVASELDARRAVLLATGSIDIASRDRLADAAAEALRSGATDVVVDLSAVSFIDSTGVGTLVGIAEAVSDIDGSFHVREPSRPVARILEVSGLADEWREGPAA
ncbi:anti-sigma B factor antagonist [Jatrophihabitans endophyticus]|uniref:Anti-sigma factor antagonist n=1 Tax=Jatrophihabitans endophyticus TaxID=1206085 RepID=A0A1M5BZH6_9ACTN|nr:STAS domain-containing protein [Jatrophihabitans endophyticus]SHF47889.1 anti-sigma B factor antagonist [Jatrophihabitans endophyticus]